MKAMNSFILLFSVIQFAFGCSKPEPETYLIPYGFKGKVNIIFNQPNGAPAKYENGRRIYEIPSSGILLTRFKLEEGIVDHQFYYSDPAGKRTKLNVFLNNEGGKAQGVGIFRDGTTGVYGNSNDPAAMPFQEFYVTNARELDSYFSFQYQQLFEEKVRKATGRNF